MSGALSEGSRHGDAVTAFADAAAIGASSAGPIILVPMFQEQARSMDQLPGMVLLKSGASGALQAEEALKVALAAHGTSPVDSGVDAAETNWDVSDNM